MSLLQSFLEKANKDLPVYITDVRTAFLRATGVECVLQVTMFEGDTRSICLRVPTPQAETKQQINFIKEYLYAEVYNMLSALGGRRLDIYAGVCSTLAGIVGTMEKDFCIGQPRSKRQGYGGCINVIERMMDANKTAAKFCIEIHPLAAYTSGVQSPPFVGENVPRYMQDIPSIEEKILCGIDIGGTDIKLACAVQGQLCYLKEYDWFPAVFSDMQQLINPIILLVRLLRARVSCHMAGFSDEVVSLLDAALNTHQPAEAIECAVLQAEEALGNKLLLFDSIGLCFPDVVINNKIVGGETLKTRGVRGNTALSYEQEFSKLMNLDVLLKDFCKQGKVAIVNDGPMAAFTAMNEMIAAGNQQQLKQGRFAHTLGTELGTGWINEDGQIPNMPLEIYNFIIDLGSYKARKYEPDDLRSALNFNTKLPGTLQKLMAQNGVYRLAIRASQKGGGSLYKKLLNDGYIQERDEGIYVVLTPKDMRKPLLEYLMRLCAQGHKDLHTTFFEIGVATGIAYLESVHILKPKTQERILYGRLVKNEQCFALIQQGAKTVTHELKLTVAGNQSAYSGLMQQLSGHPTYTIAQFAQAVGAVYFGNR